MFCQKCGTEFMEGSKFCHKCGSPAEANVATQIKPEETDNITTQNIIEPNGIYIAPKKESIGSKILKNTLSVLCWIVIFAMTFTAITAVTVRNAVSPDNVSDIVDSFDIEEFAENTDIIDELELDVSPNELEQLLENDDIKDFATDVINEYAGYILTGDNPKGIDSDDIIELVEDNESEIEDALGYEMTEREYDSIRDYFDENEDDLTIALLDEFEKTPAAKSLRISCSIYAIVGYITVIGLFILLMFLIRRKDTKSFLWSGSALIAPAFIFALALLLKSVLLGFFADSRRYMAELVDALSRGITAAVAVPCSVAAIAGLMLILCHVIVKHIKSKKSRFGISN